MNNDYSRASKHSVFNPPSSVSDHPPSDVPFSNTQGQDPTSQENNPQLTPQEMASQALGNGDVFPFLPIDDETYLPAFAILDDVTWPFPEYPSTYPRQQAQAAIPNNAFFPPHQMPPPSRGWWPYPTVINPLPPSSQDLANIFPHPSYPNPPPPPPDIARYEALPPPLAVNRTVEMDPASDAVSSSIITRTYQCEHCGKSFNRPSRARDCAERHFRTQTLPCLGQCGDPDW